MKEMKYIRNIVSAALVVVSAVGITSCNEARKEYKDAEYVMFADTLATKMVLQDQDYFTVPVASSVACDYDRTFGVEVIDKGSNAIEGKHYRLLSNTITIKAGERAADVQIKGYYDNIEPTDSLGFVLKLVMPEQLKWDLYGDQTKVVLYKSCPFQIEDFTGWAVLTSLFLYSYPGFENQDYQRLVYTEAHPTRPNTIIVRDMFFTGHDVTIDFLTDDPATPDVTMDKDQVFASEEEVFGTIYGDNKILGSLSPYYPSYYNCCQRFMAIGVHVYVEKLGISVGAVGDFYNVIEWVSDAEADRIRREGL